MKTLKPQSHVMYQHKLKPFQNTDGYSYAFQTVEGYSWHSETPRETPQFFNLFGLSVFQSLNLPPPITSFVLQIPHIASQMFRK